MKRFKEITTGHTVVMGRKTWESLGAPLTDRPNIVISKSFFENISKFNSFAELISSGEFRLVASLERAFSHCKDWSENDIFIIGGQQIYDEIFKTPELIHCVYLTRVHCRIENGDAFFRRFLHPLGCTHLPFPTCFQLHDQWDFYLKKVPNKDGVSDLVKSKWRIISEEFIPKSDKDEYDSTFQVWENRS